jgi:hypothetical protein
MDNAMIVPYFILYYSIILLFCFTMFQRVRFLKVRVRLTRANASNTD